MRQFVTIATNAFMELARQPVLLLIVTATAFFEVFLACVPYFGFGDDTKLVKDSVMAVMFLSGLLSAVLCASSSIAREIRTGTALAVLSKPVSRSQFILAKYCGIASILCVVVFIETLGALYASRIAFDAFGNADKVGLLIWGFGLALAYVAGGFSNFFFRRAFTADALLALVIFSIAAFALNGMLAKSNPVFGGGEIGAFANIDWQLIPAAILILFALWILAGLALVCSTRLDMIPTLAVCSGMFLIGLMSDYFFGRPADAGSWWASALYTITPNWSLFWLADVMNEQGKIPGIAGYLGRAFIYTLCYVGAALSAALWLFEDRELS